MLRRSGRYIHCFSLAGCLESSKASQYSVGAIRCMVQWPDIRRLRTGHSPVCALEEPSLSLGIKSHRGEQTFSLNCTLFQRANVIDKITKNPIFPFLASRYPVLSPLSSPSSSRVLLVSAFSLFTHIDFQLPHYTCLPALDSCLFLTKPHSGTHACRLLGYHAIQTAAAEPGNPKVLPS